MRKPGIGLAAIIALLVGLVMLVGQVMAAPSGTHLNWGSVVNPFLLAGP